MMHSKMIETLNQSVRQFRLGMEGEASASLASFIDLLLKGMTADRNFPLSAEDMPLLNEIIGGQQRGDYLYVADILEYKLLPRLT